MKLTEEQIKKLSDPKTLNILVTILSNPKRGIETLDILIRSPNTSAESRERYRSLRAAVENWAIEDVVNTQR